MNDQEQHNLIESLKTKLVAASRQNFVFLLIGRTGVGKSSTVNSLMGKEVAPVGDYEATTMEVKEYPSELSGIQFKVIDTPGLCDDFEEEGNDYVYLQKIRSHSKQVDSMWFVSRLDETRVTTDERRGIKLISEAFGAEVWKHAIIVFTFANKVDAEKYPVALEKRTQLIKNVITKYAGDEVASEIPSIAVDNLSETLPNGEKWMGELYTKVFTRISKRGLAPFWVATADFITPKEYIPAKNSGYDMNGSSYVGQSYSQREEQPRIELNKSQKDEIKRTIDASIIPWMTTIGSGTGFAVAGPAGAAVGAVAGAAVGLVAWLFNKD